MNAPEACTLIVELTQKLAIASGERDNYRALAQQAIHALHDVTADRDRLRQRYYRLLDEQRARRQAA
jgi:hypothetical protein